MTLWMRNYDTKPKQIVLSYVWSAYDEASLYLIL